jgi:hypothetical protein
MVPTAAMGVICRDIHRLVNQWDALLSASTPSSVPLHRFYLNKPHILMYSKVRLMIEKCNISEEITVIRFSVGFCILCLYTGKYRDGQIVNHFLKLSFLCHHGVNFKV